MGRQEKPLAELVKILRAAYPKGSRVILVQMDDIQAPPLGTPRNLTIWWLKWMSALGRKC